MRGDHKLRFYSARYQMKNNTVENKMLQLNRIYDFFELIKKQLRKILKINHQPTKLLNEKNQPTQ